MTTDTSTSPSAADRDQLAAHHVPLVAHLVRQTMARVPSSVDRNDLHSAGLLALLSAARDFEPARQVPFTEHASIRVRGALVDELRSVDWAVRAACPRDPAAARARLEAVLGRFPDGQAVAAQLEVAAGPAASAATPDGDAIPRVRADRVQVVAVALDELPQRLRHVVRGYFVDQRPMADLAAEIGSSEARAEHLRTEALILLRDALAAPTDPDRSGETLGLGDPGDLSGHHARRRLAYTRAVAVQAAARRSVVSESRQRFETTA